MTSSGGGLVRHVSELPINDRVEWSEVGLQFVGKVTYEEWEELGRTLQQIARAWQWWVGDWLLYGEHTWGEKYAQAIELTGKSEESLVQAQWVSSRVQILNRLRNLTWTHHLVVAGLDTEQERVALLQTAEEKGWSVAELRKAVRAYKRDLETPDLPTDKYRVIYADPPWKYNDQLVEGYGPAENHYQTLDIDELCELGVKDLAAPDAALFMWTTSPLLEDAFEVINAWGFSYKSSFVWDKVKHNYGHYNSVRHELLLIATRGSCTPDEKTLFDSVVEAERSNTHSEKPEVFREMIDALYPTGRRIELFARRPVDGWDVWGNEVEFAA